VDISTGEGVETDLDSYISKADAKRRKQEGERPREESYMPNLRRRDDAASRNSRGSGCATTPRRCATATGRRPCSTRTTGKR
jgi:hypothetical protein